MGSVDDYIASLAPAHKVEMGRIRQVVMEAVPSVEQGISYAMPAYMYRGKPLLSCMVRKKHLSLYPFSGKVIALLTDKLKSFETTSGSIHFSEDNPLPEPLLKEIIQARRREIDNKIG